jgi:hypothetical protein
MSVKIFCGQANVTGYTEGSIFNFSIPFQVYQDQGIPYIASEVLLSVPSGTTPYAVYALAYQMILDKCISEGVTQVPTKNDIFCYVPTTMSVILPDMPTFS